MKIGTDAILLASVVSEFFTDINQKTTLGTKAATNPNCRNKDTLKINVDRVGMGAEGTDAIREKILDVGTGCGILSLCMAQMFDNSEILAIDIDEKSVQEAANNFVASHFSEKMRAINESFQVFADKHNGKFDLIISNPPFFTSSLQSPDIRRTNARHNTSLSLQDFVIGCMKLLTKGGFVAVVLPQTEMNELTSLFKSQNVNPVLIMNVFAKPETQLKRKICIFKNAEVDDGELKTQTLYIRTASNEYSKHYRQLTSPFLL